ncbi:hypothetical protein BP6252_02894 [Coleophoma cylindrospora]|uniref:Uncharacterized protein n=1 Tax=Coleophoma cylindrospora TaxID=1849047 RepID=A0A3D8SGN2_9HELO|nr:hypothetical protein BP6252_02894 [Coleophoma cylindrospora]
MSAAQAQSEKTWSKSAQVNESWTNSLTDTSAVNNISSNETALQSSAMENDSFYDDMRSLSPDFNASATHMESCISSWDIIEQTLGDSVFLDDPQLAFDTGFHL